MNKHLAATALSLSLATAAPAFAEDGDPKHIGVPLTAEAISGVSPALAKYTRERLLGEVWKRPDLSARDRSIVTVAAIIARNQAVEMPFYFNLALDNGVKPAELSEIITHLAFYSGFPNAMSAVTVASQVFHERGIGADQLPAETPTYLPLDQKAEATRAARVDETVGPVSKGVVEYTTMLFNEIWLRPDLAPRERSMVTVSALVVSGQTAQMAGHLERAMSNGLTQAEASEVLTQLAFYGGWPNVFSATTVFKEVFAKRAG